MTGPSLGVDTGALRDVAGQFDELGNELQAAVSPMTPGPDDQPSAAAVTEVAASADHATRVVGLRLSGYADGFRRAADAYDATDATAGQRVDDAMKPGR